MIQSRISFHERRKHVGSIFKPRHADKKENGQGRAPLRPLAVDSQWRLCQYWQFHQRTRRSQQGGRKRKDAERLMILTIHASHQRLCLVSVKGFYLLFFVSPPFFFFKLISHRLYRRVERNFNLCVGFFFFVYTDMIFHVVVRSCLSRVQPTANSRSTSARKTSLAVKKNMRQRRIVKNKRHSIVFFVFSCCFFSHPLYLCIS